MPSVVRVKPSTRPPATLLRCAIGTLALLLSLGLGSAAAADVATTVEGGADGCVPGADPVNDVPTCIGEALLVVWPEPPTTVPSTCEEGRSDEASAYVLAAVQGVFYSVDDEPVSGTVDVADGARVTVLARTYPGVQFADGSTVAEHALDFPTCPAEEHPVAALREAATPAVGAQAGEDVAPLAAVDLRPAAGPVAAEEAAAGSVAGPAGVTAAATTAATLVHQTAVRTEVLGVTYAHRDSSAPAAAAVPQLAATGVPAWSAALVAVSMLLAGAGLLVPGSRP